MNDKKGQGLSLNVIIIAVIALLVLVVLAVLFTKGIIDFGEGKSDCVANTGTCQLTCEEGQATHPKATCTESEVCCISI